MTSLTDRLADLGRAHLDAPAPDTIDADLRRGRKAVHRRRLRLGAAALSLAVAGGGGAYLTSSSSTTQHRPAVAVPGGTEHLKVKLVAYKGKEPVGFDIGTIPEGYNLDLQAADPHEVLIAPAGDTDRSPNDFVGKLVVTAEAASDTGNLSSLGTESVTVGSYAGRIGDDGTATQVWWQVGDLVINVQAWDTIGLSHDQVLSFAASVSTTPQLQLSHG